MNQIIIYDMEKNDPALALQSAEASFNSDTQAVVNDSESSLGLPSISEDTPEAIDAPAEEVAAAASSVPQCTTLEQLVEAAETILAKAASEITREDINRLRGQYNQLGHAADHQPAADQPSDDEAATQVKDEEPADKVADITAAAAESDELEDKFKHMLSLIKEKKASYTAEQEAIKAANLDRKNDIIAQINALAEDTDNVNRTFPRYRELQDEFNAAGPVPATEETALWKRFQEARERFSDNLKINKELRDYDFKKNLEQKQLLIAEAASLNDESDIITAFKRLQELHVKWREIGPVAKELREEVWQKFKDASAEVSKRYQAFFEERKAREVENERAKTELCERIEAIDIDSLDSFAAWDENTRTILDAQNEWRKLGFASRKLNTVLFNRFRSTCDKFFAAKAAYYKAVKDRMAENLARKSALADEAEQLKDSTDWKKTSDRLAQMQKEWKTIGAVPKKHSDTVWKRFQQACDYFFEQKKAITSDVRKTEQANLQAKRDLIAELDKITAETPKNEAQALISNLLGRWKEIGHVPFREKDRVYEQFRDRIAQVRRAFDLSERRDRMERFETSMAEMDGDQNKLSRERERLARALETRRTELRTYENNLGFLSAKSKSGNSLVRDFERKIERLKEDIVSLQEKIRIIDDKL